MVLLDLLVLFTLFIYLFRFWFIILFGEEILWQETYFLSPSFMLFQAISVVSIYFTNFTCLIHLFSSFSILRLGKGEENE